MLSNPIRRQRGLYLPGGTPRIDTAHPLSVGLIGCWPSLNERTGSGSLCLRDLVTGTVQTPQSTTPEQRIGPAGMLARGDSNGDGYSLASPPALQKPTAEFTVLWFGSPRGAPGNDQSLIAMVSSTNPSRCWGLHRSTGSTNTDLFLIYNNGTNQSDTATAILDNGSSGLYCIAASLKTGASGPIRWAKNGSIFANSTTAGAGVINYAGTQTLRSVAALGSGNPNADTYMSAVWNRALSAEELELVTAEPTCFLAWPEDDLLALVAAAVASGRLFLPSALNGLGSGGGFFSDRLGA